MRTISLILVLITLGTPALATDGVLEINQTCAVETGCFPGDPLGYPVSITASGSYRLTSNLIVPDENTHGILVDADNVSIDLGGFEIRGPVTCSGASGICIPDVGTGSGVVRDSFLTYGTSVRNGSIRGMGGNGVLLGVQAQVSGLRVRSNRLNGIEAGDGSTISNNSVHRNGLNGIYGSRSSVIAGNSVVQNGDEGILGAGGGTLISENTARNNGGDGIFGSFSTLVGNSAMFNFGNGLSSGEGSVFVNNSSSRNELDGITAGAGCTIRGNTVRGNEGWGLDLSSATCAYRENTITTSGAFSPLGTVDGGTDAGGNLCDGSPTCP